MKKKSFRIVIATVLASSMLFSSCIGSFKLSNKLLSWNQSIDSKFVNELVFIAFCIIPVYGVSYMADILVLNSIEFWSGNNPVADVGTVKNVETKQGLYAIETKENGYTIQKEGEDKSVDLVFDEASKTWSVEAEGQEATKLMTFKENNEVVMYLPTGEEMNVTLDEAGMFAFRQVADGFTHYAAR